MKRMIIGAAGLLLSSTALAAVAEKAADPAWMPAAVQEGKNMAATSAVPVASKDADNLQGSMIHNATLIDWPAKNAAGEPASDDKDVADTPKQAAEVAEPETPSTAAMTEAAVEPEPEAEDVHDGVGGPEEATTVATTPAPATSYPPCAPGPGDDNCIQLYEPGVSEAYAAWQAGNLPGAAQTGMGGPEEQAAAEPATAESEEFAAYDEPLPEDLVLPASAEVGDNPSTPASDSTMAI